MLFLFKEERAKDGRKVMEMDPGMDEDLLTLPPPPPPPPQVRSFCQTLMVYFVDAVELPSSGQSNSDQTSTYGRN